MRFDYTTIGHVTADVFEDGSRHAGGTAFYAALQAARLGLRTRIITRGDPAEVEELLAPFSDELELELQPAPQSTVLRTSGSGSAREQLLLSWAGPIVGVQSADSAIVHLAPVAREAPLSWRGRGQFVGLTAQGLLRSWSGPDGRVTLGSPSREEEALAERCTALVLNEREQAGCARMIARARSAGAVVALTAGAEASTLLLPGGCELHVPAAPVHHARDDLGAGDVFAAAFFVALHEGSSPRESAGFASAAAALRVEGVGAGAIGERSAVVLTQQALDRRRQS